MALFVTARERRLWLWALAAVAAIYLTLGLSGTLARRKPGGGLLDVSLFFLVVFLLGMTVLTHGLRIRPRGAEIGILLGVAVVYLMMFVRTTMAERTHLLEYSVVAVFIHEALRERRDQGGGVPVPGMFAILATSLIGTVDESIQVFLPNRVFDPIDILFNFLAALMTVATLVALGWVRRRTRRRGPQPGGNASPSGF